MRIIMSDALPDQTGAIYKPSMILLNRRVVNERGRRYAFCAIMHEMVHHLVWTFWPPISTVWGMYKEEIWAYRVQLFLEKVLLVPPTWPNAHAGARASMARMGKVIHDSDN